MRINELVVEVPDAMDPCHVWACTFSGVDIR